MSQQNVMVPTDDTAASTPVLPICRALSENTTVVPEEGGMLALILHGRCAVQRLVAGHWIDLATCFSGGVIFVAGDIPVRIVWATDPGGVVFVLTADVVTLHLARVAGSLAPSAMMQLPSDPVASSLAKAFSAMEALTMDAYINQPIIDLMFGRLKQLGHDRLLSKQQKTHSLPSWRFHRVASFVQERLDRDVSLADMAAACGLSPMYFAAQFKAATGMRPHDYLILQRIEQAKRLLKGSSASILEVALSVGFQTQAHFTTVFKRVERTTPNDWRRRRLAA